MPLVHKPTPPLNPLRVFESVARLGSLTKAAQELHVTQSAISRQIATIENYLGVELLRREPRGVSLTTIGARYFEEISPAFGTIAFATRRVFAASGPEPLRIRAYTTFAAKWLMSRLPRFQQQYPDVEIRLSNSVRPVNFAADDADIAIQLGKGDLAGTQCIPLLPDDFEPVCSPALVKATGTLAIDDLRGFRLLHSRYRRTDWPDWLAAAGRSDLGEIDGTFFPNSLLAYQAAVEGLGIAIGQTYLLEREFEAGLLVKPFARPLRRSLAYYLLIPTRRIETKQVSAFREWIIGEALATLDDATMRAPSSTRADVHQSSLA